MQTKQPKQAKNAMEPKPVNTKISVFKYVTKTIWREKPLLFANYFVTFLTRLADMFQNILLPKFIIDQVVFISRGEGVETHLKSAVFYIALSLGIYFVRNVIATIMSQVRSYEREFFNEFADLEIAKKSLEIDFECTENPEVLNQLNLAREGMGWYSGGISGMADAYYSLISNLLAAGTIVSLVVIKCPILLPLQIVTILLQALINKKLIKMQQRDFKALAKNNRLFGYFFWDLTDPSKGKDIRLYNSADLANEKANHYNEEMTATWKRQGRYQGKMGIFSNLVSHTRYLITFGYIGWKAIAKVFTIGDISMLIGAFDNFYGAVWGIVNAAQDIARRTDYFNEFLKFLAFPNVKPKGSEKVKDQKHTIEFKNVSFKYPRSENFVLQNINIKIESGEHLSVVGLNGAGKTTFIKLLCRLYDVTEGEILIDGVNIKNYSEEEYTRLFAVVFQDFNLFAFSLKENILFDDGEEAKRWLSSSKPQGKEVISTRSMTEAVAPAPAVITGETPAAGLADTPTVHASDAPAAAITATDTKLTSILKQVGLFEEVQKLPQGLDTPLSKSFDEGGTDFSGGQRQRTAIARALYKNAPVVILDEPTAALDPLAEYEIYRQFNSLVGGKTAVYISHRLSSCKFCDKIAVFSDGTIKEYGSHDQLVKVPDGIYAKMFHEQAKYYA